MLMAQAVPYERHTSLKIHQPHFQMPDPVQTSTSSMQLSQMPHNMSGHAQKQQRYSRLELMKQDYEKKRQKTVQERRTEFEANTRNVKSGTVRAFFAERRAMEATADGPAYLPPIGSHFRQMKGHNLNQGSPQKTARETNIPTMSHNVQANRNNSGKNRYHRKKGKGIDKQNPLPPLQKDTVNPHKPPTPNRRYETHTALIAQDEEEEVVEAPQPVRKHLPVLKKRGGPVVPRGAPNRQYVPHPPPKQRTAALHAQKRTIPRDVSQENDDDDDDNLYDASSTHTDEPPPNLAKLKALRMKRLSQRQMNVAKDKNKLTDFQKWQMQQDKEKEERLERHQEKTKQRDEDGSLSMREKELLEKIRLEQDRLDQIKRQQQELEEQEQIEREEEEIFNRTFKKGDFEMNEKEEEQEDEETYQRVSKKPPKSKKEYLPAETVPKRTKKIKQQPPQATEPKPMDVEEQKEDFTSFYIQQAEKESASQQDLDLTPCTICGRNFQTDRLERHQKICLKSSKSTRKVFDTTKQRVSGTDQEKYIASGAHKKAPEKKARKVDWRSQHENFIKAIRYAKGDSDEPPPVMENSHYVQCPHCERKFNPDTAERHIPRCKDTKARPAPPKAKRKK